MNGIYSVLPSGEISYTHGGIPSVTDSLTYTVNDNDGATSNPATVRIANALPTGVGDRVIPKQFALYQNSPNPFNPHTAIRFTLPAAGEVKLTVYTLAGRRVTELRQGHLPTGSHEVVWDGRDNGDRRLPPGVYFLRARSEEGTRAIGSKLILLR